MSATEKMVTTADAVKKPTHDHCHPTSSKLCRSTPYLPREVIYNILIYIPAKPLFHAMRYVCKQWYDIVSDPDFVRANCRMSTPGYLIQESVWPHDDDNNHVIHIEANTPTLNDATKIQIPSNAVIVSCFNGLVLIMNTLNKEIFHVVNPMTKESISLPPLKGMSTAGLGFDSCGHCKVVCASLGSAYDINEEVNVRVFTIGIDKAWRFIDFQGIPVDSELIIAMSYSPQSFGGFIYWFTPYYHTTTRRYGFALDIDTETIYQFSQPNNDVVKKSGVAFVIMETSLGFIATAGCMWRLWILTDVKSGEWTELAPIDVTTLYRRIDEVFDPCVNMLYKPVKLFGGQLWFCHDIKDGDALIRYNFASDNMVVFPIKRHLYHSTLLSHANTLVSPKNL